MPPNIINVRALNPTKPHNILDVHSNASDAILLRIIISRRHQHFSIVLLLDKFPAHLAAHQIEIVNARNLL